MSSIVCDIRRRGWLVGLFGLCVTACRPVSLLNALIPSGNMRIRRDIAYGSHPRQRLDLYQPAIPALTAQPLMVFFYGGSWDSGSKNDYLFVAEAFTSLGWQVVIPDYRLYPELKFPQLMNDPALVVRWARQYITEGQGEGAGLYLMGHSAGAHLAMMLAVNAEYLSQVGLSPAAISGVIGLAGPYDFLPLTSDRLRAIFAPADQEWRSQPIRFVSQRPPPLLLLTGLKDEVVWPRNSIHMAKAVAAVGGDVRLITYPDYGHVDIIAKLARPLRAQSTVLSDISNWIHAHGG